MAVTFTEAGKVVTGYSHPYVAKYAASAGTIAYSDGRELARGVDVSVEANTMDANIFYANNQQAESAPAKFSDGTVTSKVDGLLQESLTMIMGLPAAGEDGFIPFGDAMDPPYVGYGFIIRWMSGGMTTYQPFVLAKVKFRIPTDSATTEQGSINWQTQSLTADIFKGEDAEHTWKWVGSDYATEAEAITALETKLGKTAA